jgi:hypothetical protein
MQYSIVIALELHLVAPAGHEEGQPVIPPCIPPLQPGTPQLSSRAPLSAPLASGEWSEKQPCATGANLPADGILSALSLGGLQPLFRFWLTMHGTPHGAAAWSSSRSNRGSSGGRAAAGGIVAELISRAGLPSVISERRYRSHRRARALGRRSISILYIRY